MAVYSSIPNFVEADSLAAFRAAVHGSYGSFTSYSYLERQRSWFLFSELVANLVLTYEVEKDDEDEEPQFLADKASVDTHVPRRRMAVSPDPHELGGSDHTPSTLAALNALVSNATLDDSGDARPPQAHAGDHQDGGAQEIDVTGLSGVLADPQSPAAHAIDGNEHTGSLPHSSTSGQTADDHHLQQHAIDGGDHTGSLAHSSLSGVGATDHHSNVNDPTGDQKAALDAATSPSGANPLVTQSVLDDAVGGRSWRDPVEDKDLTDPPGSPTTGDRYLLVGVPTGAWAGHQGEIAEYNGSSWDFYEPEDGWALKVKDEDSEYVQTASVAPWVWVESGGSTAIHGDEKHSYTALTEGGNRSDANLDELTGGGETALHDHLHVQDFATGEKLYSRIDFSGRRETVSRGCWRRVAVTVINKACCSFASFATTATFGAFGEAGGDFSVRMLDASTGDQIGPTLNLSGSGYEMVSEKSEGIDISGWPAGDVIVELQAKKTSGGGSKIWGAFIAFVNTRN